VEAKAIRNNLCALRKAQPLTQAQLGTMVGVSRQAIIAIEADKHAPSLNLAFRLANVFGCPLEAIFPNPYDIG